MAKEREARDGGPRTATERMGEFKGAFWKDPVYLGGAVSKPS